MPRIGNRKSRNGCMRCKIRKVKCDECRPSCGWCRDHSLVCEYSGKQNTGLTTHFSPKPLSVSDDHSSVSIAHTEQPEYFAKITDRRILELGLFQYYILNVAPDFPYGSKERGLLLHAQMVPQVALRCPCLLNTLFAYALLHMHVQGKLPTNADFFEEQGIRVRPDEPSDVGRISLLAVHAEYLDLALKEQRKSIANITRENGDGVCIAAIWLAMMSLVHSSQATENQAYVLPTQWFILQASFSMCLKTARPLLGMDTATSLMVNAEPTIDSQNLDHNQYRVFRDLLDWQPEDDPEIMDTLTRKAYELSIAYLQTLYVRIAEGEDPKLLGRRILAFPTISSGHFVSLLTEQRPRALAILATLLAMTKRLESIWWIFQGVGDYHIRGIASLLPPQWQWTLEWPLMIIQDGQSLRSFGKSAFIEG